MFEMAPSAYPLLEAKRALWDHQPTISVIMPTYNTPARFLREAIESVRQQGYPHWELCIADDASTAAHVRPLLQEFATLDSRIKVIVRPTNGHISAASNSAIELASGEFMVLLDHDDRLHPTALHYVAEAIVKNPSVELVFSDEDKLDSGGERTAPYFKCSFNYELFLAQNMVSHLGCFRTETVKAIGGFRLGLEGSQDWDLALRVVERVGASNVIHVPRVLYHWREIPGSTAVSTDEKPYAQHAGRRAVADHLAREGIDARVEPAPDMPWWNRVRFALPDVLPKVSIVIPTRDRVDVLKTCMDSLLGATRYPNFEVVIVDNGSVEPTTAAYLKSLPMDRVTILRDDSPFNYSRINNRAVGLATGDLICLLNNDVEIIQDDWLDELVSMASRDSVGIVGARLWYPDFRLQHAGVILGMGGVAGHAHRLTPRGDVGYFGRAALHQEMSAVTGACLMIKRSLWNALGGLDETLGVAFNDIDLCLRAGTLGSRTVWTPFAELIHYESVSRGAEDTPEKSARFTAESDLMYSRWGDKLSDDPFYSPNLTLFAEDFSISWQPRALS
jgi:glycosyltransferase involved in cell wall biosynthesis